MVEAAIGVAPVCGRVNRSGRVGTKEGGDRQWQT
jgi:hypothetical protein